MIPTTLQLSVQDLSQLSVKAKDVLNENWTGSYTIPAAGRYPHQWSWDAAFIAGIPDMRQGQKIFDYLNTNCFCRLDDTCFAAPSYDRSRTGYSPKKYWRGPVWINMNWLLSHGLERYGYDAYSERIKNTMIRLPLDHGFREYYDPDTGEGYGTENFSWTASLLLDVMHRKSVH